MSYTAGRFRQTFMSGEGWKCKSMSRPWICLNVVAVVLCFIIRHFFFYRSFILRLHVVPSAK